jgi:hypothetical protein
MNSQKTSGLATIGLLLIVKSTSLFIFLSDLFNYALQNRPQPNNYLLKPQYILTGHNTTLSHNRK